MIGSQRGFVLCLRKFVKWKSPAWYQGKAWGLICLQLRLGHIDPSQLTEADPSQNEMAHMEFIPGQVNIYSKIQKLLVNFEALNNYNY